MRNSDPTVDMLIIKSILGIVLNVAIFAVLLFLPAGRLSFGWWRAWVFLGVVFVGAIARTISLLPDHEGLVRERLKLGIQKGQPLADKIVVLLFIPAFVALITLIPLDLFRFHLIPRPGVLVSCLGLALFVVGRRIMTLALRQNAFAARVVRLQPERHQTVIDTGLYGIVRHPMYAGAILVFVGIPLWLESCAAALLASVPSGLLVLRTVVEDRFLRRELEGYDAYIHRVRCRLIPFLW